MKLKNIGEVKDFINTVDRCRGDVWLCDNEGSKLNFKSKLSQYVAIAALIKNGENFELFCNLPEDEAKFFVLMSEHPNMEI